MRILWVTNVVFPKAAARLRIKPDVSGGWLYHFAELLGSREDITLGVVCIYSGTDYQKMIIDGITYILMPVTGRSRIIGSREIFEYMKRIKRDFPPDIIHIFGTEFPLGLAFLSYFPKTKAVLNIQTLACRLEEEMDAGIRPIDFMKHLSLRECIALKAHRMRRFYASYRSRNEKKYFEKVKYVIGSTLWDKAYILNNYPGINYYSCQYLFRKAFYESRKWTASLAQPNSILVGQSAAPHKGLHILLKALFYVKKEIRNIKLYIPGPNLLSKDFLRNYSYAKYIRSLIIQYNLSANIVFTGPLNEQEMMQRMLQSMLVVVPSAIELGSSMLCEAMLLGVPVIAAFRGGMTEKFQHGISGFYYDFPEFYMLAEYIKRLIRDSELAERISFNEYVTAHCEHGEEKCIRDFCNAYYEIGAEFVSSLHTQT